MLDRSVKNLRIFEWFIRIIPTYIDYLGDGLYDCCTKFTSNYPNG